MATLFDYERDQTLTRARAIAERIETSAVRRAGRLAAAVPGLPRSAACFHLAHNWQDLPSFTPAQRRAMRQILDIDRHRFDAHRIVDRLSMRLYQLR